MCENHCNLPVARLEPPPKIIVPPSHPLDLPAFKPAIPPAAVATVRHQAERTVIGLPASARDGVKTVLRRGDEAPAQQQAKKPGEVDVQKLLDDVRKLSKTRHFSGKRRHR